MGWIHWGGSAFLIGWFEVASMDALVCLKSVKIGLVKCGRWQVMIR